MNDELISRTETPLHICRGVMAALVLAAGLVAGFGGAPAHAQGGPTNVLVDKVIEGPLTQTTPVIGRLVSGQAGVVAARSAGPIEKMLVQVGDRVEKDQVIATLVSDAIQAQLDLKRAETTMARQELSRMSSLRKRGSAAFTQQRYDDAVQKLAIARADMLLAEIRKYNAEIRAPYAGVVTQKHTDAGAYVAVGAPVVELINDRALEIEADVPATRVLGLMAGRSVRFTMGDGTAHTAVVRAVVPEENPRSRTRIVRLTPKFSARLGVLAANESVTLQIPVGQSREVVSVHKDAILNRGGKDIVFLAIDGKATPRTVQLGVAVGSRFEVLEGLKPGDIVIVRGNERLRPGQPVTFEEAGAKKPTAQSSEKPGQTPEAQKPETKKPETKKSEDAGGKKPDAASKASKE